MMGLYRYFGERIETNGAVEKVKKGRNQSEMNSVYSDTILHGL